MKVISFSITTLLLSIAINAQNTYEDALSNANYAYAHAKNAHESNNRDHIIEHSDKAIEAFYKVEELTDQCGCPDAYNAAMDGRENAEKTATQDTYERSRFYAKRARAHGERMVSLLNDCTPLNASNTAYVTNDNEINEMQNEIDAQKAILAEKQRVLAMEQSRLEKEIAVQKQKQAEFESKRLAELQEQSALKSKAENALLKLENAIKELGVVFDDNIAVEDYTRTENQLKSETLSDTKYYYAIKASEIAKVAMEQFTEYAQ